MVMAKELKRPEKPQGLASILAIATANPSNFIEQSSYADYYFRVTNSEHMTDLKHKFKRICEKSMIRKRHMFMTEEFLVKNPSICASMVPSLDVRQEMLVAEVPKLGKEAAQKAIDEWGQPLSKITHLIFCTISGLDMPGADYQLAKLLGLSSSIKRLMLYQNGCFAGGTVLRLAKDMAENNKGARVLVVCAEIIGLTFRGPSEKHLDDLVCQALFADGAASMIIGADPIPNVEKSLFEIFSAGQTFIPETNGAITARLRQAGLLVNLHKDVPKLFSENIEKCLQDAFGPLGISDWNSIFWIAHPGGSGILDHVERKLALKPEKLRATRHVLSEYGNISSACVFFILDETRKSSIKNGHRDTGGGLEWGALFGFGPGLTVDTVVLRSVAI